MKLLFFFFFASFFSQIAEVVNVLGKISVVALYQKLTWERIAARFVTPKVKKEKAGQCKGCTF